VVAIIRQIDNLEGFSHDPRCRDFVDLDDSGQFARDSSNAQSQLQQELRSRLGHVCEVTGILLHKVPLSSSRDRQGAEDSSDDQPLPDSRGSEIPLNHTDECRRPLYLKILFEEAKLWRSYDEPTAPGGSVPELLEQLFARLSLETNHGPLLVGRARPDALGIPSSAAAGTPRRHADRGVGQANRERGWPHDPRRPL